MKVRLITVKDSTCREFSLSPNVEYEVLEISGDYYRILNDPDTWPYGNDPVLFESKYFEITDPTEPKFWTSMISDGERHCEPSFWGEFLMEKYHDRDKVAHKEFWQSIRCHYPWTWEQRFDS